MSKKGAEDDEEKRGDVVEWGARSQRSIKGELYYVSCSRISCSDGGLESEDGRRIEFSKCKSTKAKRTLIVLAFLVLLNLALSTAMVREHYSTLLLRIHLHIIPPTAGIQTSCPLSVRLPPLPLPYTLVHLLRLQR